MAPTDAFDDADELDDPRVTDAELSKTLDGLMRADLTGARPGAVKSTLDAATSDRERRRLLLVLSDLVQKGSALAGWIDASAQRRAAAIAIAKAVAPVVPEAVSHNRAAVACFDGFGPEEQRRFAYRLIIVPGYTPSDRRTPERGVHPVARERLEMAVQAHRRGTAPFLLVTGANVYPRGTTVYEAIEMKDALCAMGMRPEHVIVEPRARHTTTNLRNAGRFMIEHGVEKALVVTRGGGIAGSNLFGQDFYLANPDLSTFYLRCKQSLGYAVGTLRAVEGGIELVPSKAVLQPSYDPLDP